LIKYNKEGGDLNIYKKIIFTGGLLCSMITLAANPSINEIHSCVALVDFVDAKLSRSEDIYSQQDKLVIHKGLSGYARYLDDDVITPKLLNMYGGNAAQAQLMKKLFSRQQARFIKYLDDRHSGQKFATDYAIAIKECTTKAPAQGDVALLLEQAFDTIAQ
jgi:hypothetical protein